MIEYDYDPKKATQTVCRLLKLAGGTMNYTDLLKVIYLADREALNRWGKTITTDRIVAMNQGMVVSHIYNHIKDDDSEGDLRYYWSLFISDRSDFGVSLLVDDPPYDELSKREFDLLKETFAEHGNKGKKLNDLHHDLPEWINPYGSNSPISFEKILKALGKSDEDIEHVDEESTFIRERSLVFPQR